METFALSRFGLTISAAAALLAACGGSQPPIGAPGAMQQRSGITASESVVVTRATLHRILPVSYYRVLYRFRHRSGSGAQPSASLLNVNGTFTARRRSAARDAPPVAELSLALRRPAER